MSAVDWILAALGLLVGAGVALALRTRAIWTKLLGLQTPRKPFAEHVARMRPHVTIRTPEGEGPHPAVVLMHGCGGVRAITHAYAETAVKAGAAAVIVDSLAPRGIDYETAVSEVCTGKRLWGRERAADLYAALAIMREDASVDSDRLALAGWSHGGWSVLDAMALARAGARPDGLQNAPPAPLAGVHAAFLVYPFIAFPAVAARRRWLDGVEIEAVLVEGDDRAAEDKARRALEAARAGGRRVSIDTLHGVTHAFDEPDHHPGSRLRYDDLETKRLHARFSRFIKRTLVEPSR